MEGLIILVGEFLVAPVFAGLFFLGEVIAAFFSLLLQLVFGTSKEPNGRQPQWRYTIPPKVLKWIRRVALYSLFAFIITLLLINYVFLSATIRIVADRVAAKTGIEIEFESVEGDLFSGAFVFTNLQLKQDAEGQADFQLEAATVQADLSVWNIIRGEHRIESASVSKAEITYQTADSPKLETAERPFHFGGSITIGPKGVDGVAITTKPEHLKTPEYTIEQLTLEQIHIDVTDRATATPTSYNIEIDHFYASPLRSHYALFDLLFRSDLDARLNGSHLEIINTEENGLRHTKWATHDVPASILASLVGGPFTLFESGMVDVEINDQWDSQQVDQLKLDWKIVVKNAQARLPESIPASLKPLAQIWVSNINQHPQDWEFGFRLELSEAQFKGATSLNANQIWEGSLPVILKQIAGLTEIDESVLKERTSKTVDALKGFLEKRKKTE